MRSGKGILFALSVITAQPALAWGNEGHEIIAAIARDNLTPQAKAWVDAILAQDPDTLTAPDMISRATWADKWRDSGHRETAAWHFVDNEIAKPGLKTACFNYPKPSDLPSAGPSQDCVIDKIVEFRSELADPATPAAERILALKYVLHFVGDVHQPLHASDNQDSGGNCVIVTVAGKKTNLHSFWDTGVFSSLGTDPQAVATSLEAKITAADRKTWMAGTPAQWATESFGVAKSAAYTIGSPSGCAKPATAIALTSAYQAKALNAAERQVERAGLRLAWLLNAAALQAPQRSDLPHSDN